MTDIQKLVNLSSRFYATAQGRLFDFEADQLSEAAFISKWVPLLNEYAGKHLTDPAELRLWVQLILSEVEIHLPDHQH